MDGRTMFVLCRDGDDQHERYELTCSHDRAALEAEAERRETLNDNELRAAAAASGGRFGFLERGDPRRAGYRKFYIIEIPMWPEVNE